MDNLWEAAKMISVCTGSQIVGGFDAGFDQQIPEETKDALMHFVYWVEDSYHLPVTLWVDFKHRHYLLNSDKKRVGYRFYHVDYESFSSFDSFDDIPVIELATRCEKQTMEDILRAFIEGITYYFAWLSGMDVNTFQPDGALTAEILRIYKTR